MANADISLLFGVARGGAVAEDSEAQIRKDLEEILKSINSKPLKVKVALDTEKGGQKSWSSQLQTKLDAVSSSGKFSVQVSKLTLGTGAITDFRNQLNAVINTLHLDKGTSITLTAEGIGEIKSKMKQAGDAASDAANKAKELSQTISDDLGRGEADAGQKAAQSREQIVAFTTQLEVLKTVLNGVESAFRTASFGNKMLVDPSNIEKVTNRLNEFKQRVDEAGKITNLDDLSRANELIKKEAADIVELISSFQKLEAAEKSAGDQPAFSAKYEAQLTSLKTVMDSVTSTFKGAIFGKNMLGDPQDIQEVTNKFVECIVKAKEAQAAASGSMDKFESKASAFREAATEMQNMVEAKRQLEAPSAAVETQMQRLKGIESYINSIYKAATSGSSAINNTVFLKEIEGKYTQILELKKEISGIPFDKVDMLASKVSELGNMSDELRSMVSLMQELESPGVNYESQLQMLNGIESSVNSIYKSATSGASALKDAGAIKEVQLAYEKILELQREISKVAPGDTDSLDTKIAELRDAEKSLSNLVSQKRQLEAPSTDYAAQLREIQAIIKAIRSDFDSIASGRKGTASNDVLEKAKTAYSLVEEVERRLSTIGDVVGLEKEVPPLKYIQSIMKELKESISDVGNTSVKTAEDIAEFRMQIEALTGQKNSVKKSLAQLSKNATTEDEKKQIAEINAAYEQWAIKIEQIRATKTAVTGTYRAELEAEGAAISANITRLNEERTAAEATAKAEATAAKEAVSAETQKNAAMKAGLTLLGEMQKALKDWTAAKSGSSRDEYTRIQNSIKPLQDYLGRLESGEITVSEFKKYLSELSKGFTTSSNAIKAAGENTKTFGERFGGLAKKFGTWLSVSRVIMAAVRTIRQMVTNVIELDSAMAQLKIVTGATDVEMERFLSKSTSLAKELGRSVTEVLSSIETFSRLGYNLNDSSELAKYASILANTANVDVDEATTGLTAIIKGYNMDVKNAEHVADVLIDVGQKYAVSASELIEAYEKSGAALNASNTSFEKSAGLIAAANASVQNASTVGTAIKTVSARVRGATTELEELGEDTSDLAQGFSKYAEEIKAITGFSILEDGSTDTYKDVYDMFQGISGMWKNLSDTQQARVAEILGGTRQLQVISSILTNWKDAADAYADAMNSAGTATEANAIHMDSLKGSVGTFKTTFQELSNTVIDSDFAKSIVDLGTSLLDILNTLIEITNNVGGLKTIVRIVAGIAAIKLGGVGLDELAKLITKLSVAKAAMTNSAVVAAAGTSRLSAALKALGVSASAAKIGLGLLFSALMIGIGIYQEHRQKIEEMNQAAKASAIAFNEEASSLSDYQDQIRTLRDELDAGNLSEAEAYSHRKSLLEIQEKLIESYGDEAKGINLVTGEIEGQINALNGLTQSKWNDWRQENTKGINNAISDFQNFNPRDHGWWNASDHAVVFDMPDIGSRFAYDFDQEIRKALGENEKSLSKFESDLISRYTFNTTGKSIDEVIEMYRRAYDTLERLGKQYFPNETDFKANIGEYLNDISEAITKYDSYASDSRATYETYMRGVIAYNEKYSDIYSQILSAQADYEDAVLSGDTEAISKAIEDIDAAKQAWLNANWDDGYVNDFVAQLFDDIEKASAKHRVIVKLQAENPDEWMRQVLSDLQAFADENGKIEASVVIAEGSAAAEANVVNEHGVESKQSAAYNRLNASAGEYGLTLSELLSMLESYGFVQNSIVDSTDSYKGKLTSITSALSDLKSAYSLLDSTENDMADGGGLSPETIKNLSEAEENYLDYLYEENGVIKLNTEAWKKNADAKVQDKIGNIQQDIISLNEQRAALEEQYPVIADYYDLLGEVSKKRIDLDQTVYGNIDTNNRQVLEWTEENLNAYKSAIESWGYTVDEMRGTFSTVFGTSGEFDGVEIAFSPMLQTENGAVLLDADTVDEYIWGLIDKAGENWSSEDLLSLDTEGLVIDGRRINNLLADIGYTAIQTGEAMHYTGNLGAVAGAYARVKEAAEESGMSVSEYMAAFKENDKATTDLEKAISILTAALDDDTSAWSRLFEQSNAVKDGISTLKRAFDELNENGSVSYSALASIQEKFSDVSGIDDYISKLAAAKGNSEEVARVMGDMIDALVEAKFVSEDLADANENVIAAMLDEAGVANSAEYAHWIITQAKIKNAAASYDLASASDTALASLLNEIQALLGEGDAAQFAEQYLYALRMEKIRSNDTQLDNSATVDSLIAIAATAGASAESLKAYAQAQKLVEQGTASGFRSIEDGSFDILRNDAVAETNRIIAEIKGAVGNAFVGGSVYQFKPPSSGGSSRKEIEEYIATIDAYREAKERLRKAELARSNVEIKIDDTENLKEQIALEDRLIGAYRREQEALHNLNNRRDATIAAGVKSLHALGFAVQYNADTNDLWIDNLEHLNELQAKSKGGYDTVLEATNALRKDTEDLVASITGLNDENREASSNWEELQRSIHDARQQIVDDLIAIVTEASDAVDEIQNVYDTMMGAVEEYREMGGHLTIDTYQKILELGPQYLRYIQDENGELIVNEESIRKVTAAKTEQLALESAMSYIERLRLAMMPNAIENLNELLYATTDATDATWGLVYANLGLLDLNGDQYQAALDNINAMRALAENAQNSIGMSADSMKEKLVSMQSGVNDLLKYVMDMLKQEIQNQIEDLEDMKKSFADIIALRKEALDAAKDEADYDDEVAKKVKEIAKIQARINKLSLDDSRDAQAQKAKLEEEMAELQKQLADYQSDHALEAQKDALDKMQTAYEEEKDNEIEKLEDSIRSYQKLYDKAISYISEKARTDWDSLLDELTEWNFEYGSELSSTIEDAWANATLAAKEYGDYLTALKNLSSDIANAPSSWTENKVGNSTNDSYSSDNDRIEARVNLMEKNAASWHNADKATQDYLEADNERIAAELSEILHTRIWKKNGVWYVGNGEELFKKYHTGGVVGDRPTLKQNEVLAVLEKEELVLDKKKQEKLQHTLDFFSLLAKQVSPLLDQSSLSTVFAGMRTDLSGTQNAPLNQITNSRSANIHFGDMYFYGNSDELVEKHRDVNRQFVNEILGQLNIRK